MRFSTSIAASVIAALVASAAVAQPPPAAPAAPVVPPGAGCSAPAPPPTPPAAAGRAATPATPAAPAAAGRGGPAAPAAGGRGPATPPIPATQPQPRDDARHKAFVQMAQAGNVDLLFVGDSITDWWCQAQRGLPEWNKTFGLMRPANFGIAGDTTQGVLWRMQNGELEGIKPKVIVFMLGTNNINRNAPADIAAGDAAIVNEFRTRQPQAKVLILGVFPRGEAPDNAFRPQIAEINTNLAKLADNQNVFYLDIGPKFLTPDGHLTTDLFPDGLHPNLKGYEIWSAAIMPKVQELMR